MKKFFKLFGIIALVAVIGFSFTACGGGDDGGGDGGGGGGGGGGKIDYTANGIDELAAWLVKQPANGAASPYTVKLKVNDLTDFGLLSKALDETGRYVYLDLSGSVLTKIPDRAFYYVEDGRYKYCVALTGITIPNGVTSIGERAFQNCTSLTSVTIPDSVTSIEYEAFQGCTSLASVTIPDSVTTIGSSTFYGCTSLTSINIPASVTSIGGSAFSGTAWFNNQPDGLVYAGKVAYTYKGSMPANTSITLLDGTKEIAGSAFQNCTSLASVTIPNSVTSIGGSAFYNCTSLTSVTFQGTITADNLGGIWIFAPFPGDLREKYLATTGGGIGTYTRPDDSDEWTKQN